MKNNILHELRYINMLPAVVRDISAGLDTIQQVLARAADEIEKLRNENKRLRKDPSLKSQTKNKLKLYTAYFVTCSDLFDQFDNLYELLFQTNLLWGDADRTLVRLITIQNKLQDLVRTEHKAEFRKFCNRIKSLGNYEEIYVDLEN